MPSRLNLTAQPSLFSEHRTHYLSHILVTATSQDLPLGHLYSTTQSQQVRMFPTWILFQIRETVLIFASLTDDMDAALHALLHASSAGHCSVDRKLRSKAGKRLVLCPSLCMWRYWTFKALLPDLFIYTLPYIFIIRIFQIWSPL